MLTGVNGAAIAAIKSTAKSKCFGRGRIATNASAFENRLQVDWRCIDHTCAAVRNTC
jgi:hypothetical protein